MEFIENKNFRDKKYSENELVTGEYGGCSFTNCNFSNANLSEIVFTECKFENCDLSMAKLVNTTFGDVEFSNCKLLGLRFDSCNKMTLALNFSYCNLNFASFYKLKLKKARFDNCKMEEVEFAETDLTGSVFNNCDLVRAVFENTILEGCDLRTSFNFSINPEINRIVKAKFSHQNIAGLLYKYNLTIE
ncbi:MAG: pentapeptide repeat-containing protein [Bacteroidales bacterium]|jgi:uncharacterized protein YjbI with pentapeptide repeats